MKRHHFLHHGVIFFSFIVLSSIPEGIFSLRLVTLGSIEIFTTHEWVAKPIVYFGCNGENTTILPDVKRTNLLYTFKGQESWQPLVELPEKKCKRCGIYEMDTYKSDDVYDEWEMCSDDFVQGKYERFKEREFNATFHCSDCGGTATESTVQNSTVIAENGEEDEKRENTNIAIIVVVSILVFILVLIVSVYACKYYQRRKREQDQLRFLKLFEEGDEIEDEIALGHVI